MDVELQKYTKPKKRGATSERAEIADNTAKLLKTDIKKVLGWTRHLQPDQMYRLLKEANNTPQFWWKIYRQKYMKNNIDSEVKEKLEKFPEFRERNKRADYLAKLALRSIKLEEAYRTRPLNLSELAKFAIKFASYERSWRNVTMTNKHLQGSDYDNKELLEKQRQSELGYINNN